jgi:hypothetical protein
MVNEYIFQARRLPSAAIEVKSVDVEDTRRNI